MSLRPTVLSSAEPQARRKWVLCTAEEVVIQDKGCVCIPLLNPPVIKPSCSGIDDTSGSSIAPPVPTSTSRQPMRGSVADTARFSLKLAPTEKKSKHCPDLWQRAS